MKWAKQTNGFTIVELLIVIVVIGILAAITVVAFNGVQERSKVASAESELRSLEKAILAARVNTNKNLMEITFSNCTQCASDVSVYNNTIDRISAAAGVNISGLKDGDPWGNRYFIDENEGEGANPCSSRDAITYTGRSGSIAIPFHRC